MTGASSLAFPGSRTLANWWRQLSPYEPEFLWVGYLFLHRVEACVLVRENRSLDRLSQFLLQALDVAGARHAANGACEIDRFIEDRTRLGPAITGQLMKGLASQGLIAGPTPAQWLLTPFGRAALEQGAFPISHRQRRVFTFVERLDAAGRRTTPAHFFHLAEAAGADWDSAAGVSFDIECLRNCPAQSGEWKTTFGFPSDVEKVLERASESSWEEVIVDRPERLFVALALGQAASAEKRLLGFAGRSDGWVLESRQPIANLPSAACAFAPELSKAPSREILQSAWQGWCQTRSLPPGDAEACQLDLRGGRLSVTVPPRLAQRLQASRSDILKGDAWLLAGDGYLRQALSLEIKV